ncbi:MAG: hypothetical protein J6S05_00890 [Bacteroidaceae bacterium]|nr:hypothetical protein [Bacteroidaceae bacterium]
MKVKSLAFLLMCAVATYYGGAKFISETKRVNFPRTDPDVQHIVDHGSYVTNDCAYISFSTIALPSDALIIVAYAPPDATNESQVVTVAALTRSQWLMQFPGKDGADATARFAWDTAWGDKATDYVWYCYTTWAPAPSVHTNGVLNCYGIKVSNLGILKRTVLIENGRILSPDEILGDFEDSKNAILNAETYEGVERKPYELEEYFDINR